MKYELAAALPTCRRAIAQSTRHAARLPRGTESERLGVVARKAQMSAKARNEQRTNLEPAYSIQQTSGMARTP